MHAFSRLARRLFSPLLFLGGGAAQAQNTTYTGNSTGFSLWGIGPWSNGVPTTTGNATVTPNVAGDAGLIFPFGGITLHGLTIGDSAAPFFLFTLSSQGGSDALTFSGANAYLTQPANSGNVYLDTKITLTSNGLLATIDGTTTTGLAISGTGSIDKYGSGTLRIGVNSSNVSDATGRSLNINAGTVSLGAGGANGSVAGVIQMNDSAVILQLYRTDAFTHINDIMGGGTIAQIGTGTATLSGYLGLFNGKFDVGTSAPLILSGSSVGSFTKQGAGTLIIASSIGPNTITMTAGTLQIGNGGTTGNLASNTNISLPLGTTLVLNRTDDFTFNASTSGNGTISKLGTNTVTLHLPDNGLGIGLLSIAGGHLALENSTWHVKGTSGAGTLDILATTELQGAATHTGGTTVTGSSVRLTLTSGGTLAGNLVLNAGTSLHIQSSGTQLLPGNVSGAGSIVMSTNGTTILAGNVAPTGGLDIEQGTIRVGNASTTGALTGTVNVEGSGVLEFNRSDATTMALAMTGQFNSNITQNGTGNVTLTGTQTMNGTVTVNSTGQLIFGSTSGTFDKRGSGTLVLNGAGTGQVVVYGGTVQIGNVAGSSYSGSTYLEPGTTLQLNATADFTSSIAIRRSPFNGSGGVLKTGNFNTILTDSTLSYTGSTVISAGTLTFQPSSDLLLNTAISGAGALVKAGTSILTLPNSTAPGGGTTVSGGTLTISNTTFSGAVAVAAGATLNLTPTSGIANYGFSPTGAGNLAVAGSSTALVTLTGNLSGLTGNISLSRNVTLDTGSGYTLANTLSGSDALPFFKAGSGTIILTANSPLTTPLTINAGTVQLGSGGSTGSIAGNIALNGGSLVFNRNNAQTLTNILSGSGTVVQQGSGTVALTGNHSFTGTYQVTGGDLTLGSTTGFTKTGSGLLLVTTAINSGNIVLGNGTLQIGNATAISIPGSGNIATSTATTLAFNETNAVSVSGMISGAGQLIHAGTGTLTLTGANTISGGIFLNAGKVAASTDARLGGSTNGLTFNGGALEFTGTYTVGSSRAIALNSGGGTFEVDPTLTTTINQAITGTGSLTKNGTGTLTLGGANTYGGATTITAGTLKLGANSAIPIANTVSIASTATLDLGNRTQSLSALTGSGSILLGTGSLSLGTGNTTIAYAGNISNAGSLTKTGTGVLTLSGNSTYSGGTTLNTGTIALGSANALGTGTLTVNGGALVMASNTDLAVANPISLASDLLFAQRDPGVTGALTLSGPVALTGDRTITSFDYPVFSGVVSGAHSLSAAGIVIFSGNNTFSGGLNIANGSYVLLGHDNAAGTGTLAMTDATLQPFNSGRTLANAFSLTGDNNIASSVYDVDMNEVGVAMTLNGAIGGTGTLSLTGIGTFILPRANTFSGTIDLSGGTLRLGHDQALGTATLDWNGGTLEPTTARTLTNPFSLGSTLQFGGSVDLTLNGVVAGSALLTKNGTSTLVLGNSNTYTGTTTLSSGTLALGADQALGNSNVTISGGTLATAGGDRSIGNILTFTGDTLLGGSNSFTFTTTATLDGNRILTVDTPVTFAHGLVPVTSASLTKAGSSTLTLLGTSTYTGATTISSGILSLGAFNAISSSSPIFLNGGMLRTTGFNQTLGALTLTSNSIIDFANLSSILTFDDSRPQTWNGTLTITNYNTASNSLRFGSDGLGLTATQLSSLRFADYGNSFAVIDGSGFLSPSAIPEPSTYAALLGAGALGVAAYRRRRNKQ